MFPMFDPNLVQNDILFEYEGVWQCTKEIGQLKGNLRPSSTHHDATNASLTLLPHQQLCLYFIVFNSYDTLITQALKLA